LEEIQVWQEHWLLSWTNLALHEGAQTTFGVPDDLGVPYFRTVLKMFRQQASQFSLIDVTRQTMIV
jgi:hypothetical protein